MKKERVRFIQHTLNAMGLDAGVEDGLAGANTFNALARAAKTPEEWSRERRLVGFIQALAREAGIDAGPLDGYWGPQTEFAFDELKTRATGDESPRIVRPEELPLNNPNHWPKEVPQNDLVRHFGEPGENQASLTLPYPHRLSWKPVTTVTRFSCHEKVHDSMARVLNRVLDHYGPDGIKQHKLDLWGGCLNVRKKRGGNTWSTHSWGIAVDYNPGQNKLAWGRDRASFAKPEYDVWWKLWEEEGWVSLGRSRNFDWMHVQACVI